MLQMRRLIKSVIKVLHSEEAMMKGVKNEGKKEVAKKKNAMKRDELKPRKTMIEEEIVRTSEGNVLIQVHHTASKIKLNGRVRVYKKKS